MDICAKNETTVDLHGNKVEPTDDDDNGTKTWHDMIIFSVVKTLPVS